MDTTPRKLATCDLAGGPSFDRGELVGRQTIQQIGHSLATYRLLIPFFTKRSWEDLVALARPMIEASRALDEDLVDELQGVAIGAAASFDDISVLAVRSELLQLGPQPIGECTTVITHNEIGQTWDWFIRQLDACIVWRTEQFIAFGEGGMPAKVGVNANGVAVTLNFLSTGFPPDPSGLPVHILLQHLLERATSTADGIERLMAAPSAACAAVGLLDRSGHGAVVELAPHGRNALITITEPFIQTNHCLSIALAGEDTPGVLLDNSVARLTRANGLIAANAPIAGILADNDGSKNPIAFSAGPNSPHGMGLGTVLAVIIDVQKQTMRIAPGNPAEVGFTQLLSLKQTPP